MTAVEEREVSLAPARDLLPRITSRDPQDFAVPTGREEAWRFTPMAALEGLLSDVPSTDSLSAGHLDLPAGVTVAQIEAGAALLADLPMPVDRPAALAQALASEVTRIVVAAGAELTEPVHLELTGSGGLVRGRTVIELGANARATVIVTHRGTAQYAAHTSVIVGDGAELDLVQVQAWDAEAVHAAQVAIRLGRDSRIKSTQVSLGGRVIRIVETVEYCGPGGEAELVGVYFADAGQHIEHRLLVDHSVANCRSNVLYKGALQGAGAHTVWVGDVLIRAAATGTDTYELNRNLILSEGARADSVPNLEIETGEIAGAGHASATGRFDDEQLFYLMCRGVPESVARRLVVRGFFADVIQRIAVAEVRDRLMAAVDAELGEIEAQYDFGLADSGEGT
jgi:Fe-S cluster assembly protein SufD